MDKMTKNAQFCIGKFSGGGLLAILPVLSWKILSHFSLAFHSYKDLKVL